MSTKPKEEHHTEPHKEPPKHDDHHKEAKTKDKGILSTINLLIHSCSSFP
jgi:hypothetical protein